MGPGFESQRDHKLNRGKYTLSRFLFSTGKGREVYPDVIGKSQRDHGKYTLSRFLFSIGKGREVYPDAIGKSQRDHKRNRGKYTLSRFLFSTGKGREVYPDVIGKSQRDHGKYIMRFDNNYLLRGIMSTLDSKGFLPIGDEV